MSDLEQPNATSVFDVLGRAVWPVVARSGGEWQPHGTGFVISNSGLLVTARHVVEYAARQRPRRMGPDGCWLDEGDLFALSPSTVGADGQTQPPRARAIVRADFASRGDIAVCQLDLEGEVLGAALVLRPGRPRVGERVFAFGYPRADVRVIHESSTQLDLHMDANAVLAGGLVREVHSLRKEHSISDFPSATVSMGIKGGMSGSPVLGERGAVVGVISHSPSWEDTATMALVGFALATTVHPLSSDGGADRPVLLRDLIRAGTVRTDGSETDVIVVPAANGTYDVFTRDSA